MTREEAERLLAPAREAELIGPESSTWVERRKPSRQRLLEAVRFFASTGHEEAASELAANVWRLWVLSGDVVGRRQLLAAALDVGESKASRAPALVPTDIASGLNPRRKGLWQAFELACRRQIQAVAVTDKDRLNRFGFEYLEAFLAAYGVEILVLHVDDDQAPEQELVADLLALVTPFAGRLYGPSHRRLLGLNATCCTRSYVG
jgi:hypothetical protein